MKKIVIIGGVAGGASAAARLRRLDEEAEIIILERGPYISYANCGLPYYIGDIIDNRDALLLNSPEDLKEKYNVDVRVKNEAISIDKDNKEISIKNKEQNKIYKENYDELIISTGSSPLVPPIDGIDSDKIMPLWTVPDTDKIKNFIDTNNVKSAAVIGGGFIGLEMAHNLYELGLDVSIIERDEQVMAPLDKEMAALLHEEIMSKGVELILGDGVESFKDKGKVTINLESGKSLEKDFVILSIGVRPNSEIAKDAGIELNDKGGIKVNNKFETNIENIYAIGDVIEVDNFVSKDKTMIPLAGPANKMGRMIADLISGFDKEYIGSLGTAVAKIFDLTAANTGLNEKALKDKGLEKRKDYDFVIIRQNSHAGYYPGATQLTLKVIFDLKTQKILGAQAVGYDGVDKRIDVLSTSIKFGATIKDLTELELAYAPPYSSAKDPANMAGFTAENVINDLVAFSDVNIKYGDNLEEHITLLDVRTPAEVMAFEIPGAVNIPLNELRNRLDELDKNKHIVVFCAIDVRAYNALRLLKNNGFKDVCIYPGGARYFKSINYKALYENNNIDKEDKKETNENEGDEVMSLKDMKNAVTNPEENRVINLNCSGMQCTATLTELYQHMHSMKVGDIVEVKATDPDFSDDVINWVKSNGHTLLSNEKVGDHYIAKIKKEKNEEDK